jgi:hypothetical protein
LVTRSCCLKCSNHDSTRNVSEPALLCGILKDSPSVGAVPSPLTTQPLERREETLTILRRNLIFYCHKHRPPIVLDLQA